MEALNLQYSKYLHHSHHRLSSVIGLEALKFFAITALPQITQAISYILCCFLTSEGYVGPIVVYKVIQTIYMSSISISTISQFTNNVHQARLGAREMNDIFEAKWDKINSKSTKAKVFAA
uniref:Uncharacterized protein n=1 Tax=Panagrolaimus sp. ES5 TaxID=591445 RepID=A0AC34GH62_9BILA